jgi:hypothetical protein
VVVTDRVSNGSDAAGRPHFVAPIQDVAVSEPAVHAEREDVIAAEAVRSRIMRQFDSLGIRPSISKTLHANSK